MLGINRDPASGAMAQTGKASALVRLESYDTNAFMTFQTSATNNAEPTERMRIDKDGNVGIGTTIPEHRLHIRKSSGNSVLLLESVTGGDPELLFNSEANNRTGFIRFLDNGAAAGIIKYDHQYERMSFHLANSGIGELNIDGGDVGIGTENPSAKLEVVGAIKASGNITGGMSLYTTRDNVAGALTAGYDLGYLYFGGRDSDSGWHRTAARISADVAGTWTSSSCATELQFATTAEGSTSNNEVMILDSGGRTLVHKINFGYVAHGSALRSDASFIHGGTSGSNLSYYSDEDSYWYQYDGGWQQRMHLNDAGTLTAVAWSTSDIALKENITDITGGLSLVKQLRPVNFDWKESAKGTGVAGFIAQEVETILPNEVQGDDWEATVVDEENPENDVTGSIGKGLSVIGIVAHLTKAIQELEARITTLEG